MPRWKTNAREMLLKAFADNPNLTRSEALAITGISRQRLHQLWRETGIFISPDPRVRLLPARPQIKIESLYEGMSPYLASCVSEMAVCLDLLMRHYDVYKSVTSCGRCDLVAVHRGTEKTLRIEVKTARRSQSGKITHSPTRKNKFDVLALVFSGGEIVYTPALG